MDRKTKIFFIIFFLLIAGAVAVTYWRIMVKKDYVVEAQVDCDPTIEKCFIWECDAESTVEGEACTGDAETDVWYYKIARRNASLILLCDPNTDENLSADEAGCDPWTCELGEKDCSETLCDETTKAEQGVECNDPEEYLLNNPPEESNGCVGGDEECLTGDQEKTSDEEETPVDTEL